MNAVPDWPAGLAHVETRQLGVELPGEGLVLDPAHTWQRFAVGDRGVLHWTDDWTGEKLSAEFECVEVPDPDAAEARLVLRRLS